MNYTLNTGKAAKQAKGVDSTLARAMRNLVPLLSGERKNLTIALVAVLLSSLASLAVPILISHAIDNAILQHDFSLVVRYALLLLAIFVAALGSGYVQTIRMGGVGRRVLFRLRNALFTKLQELPVAFFYANKTGDLISRINNDTDKLNQFFAQALMQFIGSFFVILGAGMFLVVLNPRLGMVALLPALGVFVLTQLLSGWVKERSRQGLQTLGALSAEIQESLNNFKVIVAFNRLDYFRNKFSEVNETNYHASIGSGIASNIFTPIYGLASNLAQLAVIGFGIYLISGGSLTIGLLIGYLLYVNSFYTPLRQLATVWSSLQLALASLDRISEVLQMESNMPVALEAKTVPTSAILSFENVAFGYTEGQRILHDVSLELLPGKTYALVGPTGGGKTTTASLMARLYDPTEGVIYLNGKDIRAYQPEERAQKIGFILQEPFLFTGTVGENIVYGNPLLRDSSAAALEKALVEANLAKLLERFPQGLASVVTGGGEAMSLGQKQLIAFMRAALRRPELLILDEATANIDTVTEQLLEEILALLPASTTKVIIAHRLNTIREADEIFFVNSGTLTAAGSLEHAVELLLHGHRTS